MDRRQKDTGPSSVMAGTAGQEREVLLMKGARSMDPGFVHPGEGVGSTAFIGPQAGGFGCRYGGNEGGDSLFACFVPISAGVTLQAHGVEQKVLDHGAKRLDDICVARHGVPPCRIDWTVSAV